jgi:hypothetical protein
MHVGCIVKRRHHAKSYPEYVPGDPCPLLVPVDDVPVESSEDEDDAAAVEDEEACDWDEAGSSSDEEA